MPEDSGKKKSIQNFLLSISSGEGFIEDIWIERNIRSPGSPGEGSTAISLSERKITNLTELLGDDLKHSFYDGYFTFRIITAMKGSGKTSLLTYLNELIKVDVNYQRKFVVSRFPITDILSIGGDLSFNIKLYCNILSETFWSLIKSSEFLVQEKSKEILKEYFQADEFNHLVAPTKKDKFCSNFMKFFSSSFINPQNFLFETIYEILKVDPHYVFVYLIDELDGLENRVTERQETLVVIRSLVKRVAQRFGNKVRLFIYLVGTNENMRDFFREDPVLESLVSKTVVDLNTGYQSEFKMIKSKINDRIKGAFKGYKNFDDAWAEIEHISLEPGSTLREFCQDYSRAVLKIYQKYFNEAPEQHFEGKARDLVEAVCRQHWDKFLKQSAYKLSPVSTTTILEKHAFDCYVELLHNGVAVARGYGEAKNYELLSEHLKTFGQWLQDVRFKGSASDTMFDLAFMIAPSCPTLLQRKLELQNIHFIQTDKVVIDISATKKLVKGAINLNDASQKEIKSVLSGIGFGETSLKNLMKYRPFNDLNELCKNIKINSPTRLKIQDKISNGEVYF